MPKPAVDASAIPPTPPPVIEPDIELLPVDQLAAIMPDADQSDDEEPEATVRTLGLYVPESDAWFDAIEGDSDLAHGDVCTFPITHEQALKGEHAEDADPAVKDELENMHKFRVWEPTYYGSLTAEDKKGCIPSGLYIKYKSDADSGAYTKSKARLHGGGHRQRAEWFGATASFMINLFVVFFVLKVAAALDWNHAVYDVNGAFLHAPRRHPVRQIMRLTPRLTALWVELHPEDAKFVHTDGCLYVIVLKALYGLKDSGAEWFHHLNNFLHSHGYETCDSDPCLYKKFVSATDFAYVLTHVDDLFLVGVGDTFASFGELLVDAFKNVASQLTDNFTYLGMAIRRNRPEHAMTICQRSYIVTMLANFGLTDCKPTSSPSDPDLLSPESDANEACDKTLFLSIVMSLMYLARISRPDILFPVTFLATKSSAPTTTHLSQVKRVLRFLKGTMHLALRFAGTALDIVLYADASHGLYADGKGHHGLIAVLGGDHVLKECHKMKVVTLSSTESEIVAAVHAATYLRWILRLLQELMVPVTAPVTLFQDNQSAMHMIQNGCTWRKTKHMVIRTHFARGLIEEGLLRLEYVPTDDMLADILTKPYAASQMVRYTVRAYTKLEQ